MSLSSILGKIKEDSSLKEKVIESLLWTDRGTGIIVRLDGQPDTTGAGFESLPCLLFRFGWVLGSPELTLPPIPTPHTIQSTRLLRNYYKSGTILESGAADKTDKTDMEPGKEHTSTVSPDDRSSDEILRWEGGREMSRHKEGPPRH